MRKILGGLLAAVLAGAAPAGAADAAEKVGVIDTKRVLQNLSDLKAATARLEASLADRVRKYRADEAALNADLQRFQREQSTLTETQRQKFADDYSERQRRVDRERNELNDLMARQQTRDLDAVQPRVNEALKTVAAEEGVTLVLERSASGVYVVDERIDLTDRVIRAYEALLAKKP